MPMSSPQMTRIFGFFCSCFAISFSFHFLIFVILFAVRKVFPFLLLLILVTSPSSSRRIRTWIAYPHWSILRNWMPALSSVRNCGRHLVLLLPRFVESQRQYRFRLAKIFSSEMQQTCL